MNNELFDFIKKSPTAFHAVKNASDALIEAGYRPLCEGRAWHLEPGSGYFLTRNQSSLIAFRVPRSHDVAGFMMCASHGDSPAFRVKENAEEKAKFGTRLSVEKYGGMLCSTWFDRPLGIAGRAVVRTETGVEGKLVDLGGVCAIIPNVAIHMNRKANDGVAYDAAVDMLPLAAADGTFPSLRARVADALGVAEEDILSTDLSLYNPQAGVEWNGLIAAPRLDDLQCVFASLRAFLDAEEGETVPVFCLFDNEEVGSQTKQGAASTFLSDTLSRVCHAIGRDDDACRALVANSFLVSCDNAHGLHPNHPEYADPNHTVKINGGVVIKYNANQHYTSDGISSAIFREICARAGVPVQLYANRADLPGGSTLGNIANTQVSLNTVDIGLSQLAMHSAYETAGAEDTAYLVDALRAFYESTIHMDRDGTYSLE